MSLTNPNKVITEERLSEFYQGILPYLGGMPEALANKFSRSDLYSTDEKMVGCWIDGKPLYAKVFTNLNMGGTTSNWTATGVTLSSADTLVDVRDLRVATTEPVNDVIREMNFKLSNSGALLYYTKSGFAGTHNLCCLYTKTTDAANSFKYGTETDYSTDEKIIGTWIDGKPLYQTTIITTMSTVSTDYVPTHKNISIATLNADIMVSVEGMFTNGNIYLTLIGGTGVIDTPASSQDSKTSVWYNKIDKYINLEHNRVAWSERDCYITLRYTKTTD